MGPYSCFVEVATAYIAGLLTLPALALVFILLTDDTPTHRKAQTMTDDRVVELKSYRGYIAVEQCDLDFEEAIREAYAVNGPVVSLIAEFRERFQRIDPSIAMLKAAVDALEPFAAIKAEDGDEDLARLLQLAAAGHEGVDLGELTDEELDAWIKRH